MISGKNRKRYKIKCVRCQYINFYDKDDVFDGEHKNERCVSCEECGKIITLKKKI
mgnify:CR=1 FL=1